MNALLSLIGSHLEQSPEVKLYRKADGREAKLSYLGHALMENRNGNKVSKSSVDYSRGHADGHCGQVFDDDKGYCRYFIEPPTGLISDLGTCEKVQGEIVRVFWCRLFARAHSK